MEKEYEVNKIFKINNFFDILNELYAEREAYSSIIDEESLIELIEVLNGKEVEFYKHPQGLVIDDTINKQTKFDFYERKDLKRRKFYGRELTSQTSFFDFDTIEFEKSVRSDNANFLNNEHESFAKISIINNLSLKEREEGHQLIDLDYELFIIEKKIMFLVENNPRFKWSNEIVSSLYEEIYEFCEKNDVNTEVTTLLLKTADTHSWMGSLFFNKTREYIVSKSDYLITIESEKGWYEKEIGIIPTPNSFSNFLSRKFEYVLDLFMQDHLKTYLAEHVFQEVSNNRKYYQQAQEKHQTLSIETTTDKVEEGKKEMTFNDLFPSIEDKEMVMQMLVALKIINSEGKYLLGTKTGIIRVFIDVMKEEGYFVDIERKPILRIFTPVILGRRIEVINEPLDFDVMKRRILIKLKELIK